MVKAEKLSDQQLNAKPATPSSDEEVPAGPARSKIPENLPPKKEVPAGPGRNVGMWAVQPSKKVGAAKFRHPCTPDAETSDMD